jgi:lipid A disaccharide synthetase
MAYVLFCAGEDSGDSLGAPLVRETVKLGFRVVGAGGVRMQSAGLEPIVNYELLPVSGFGDVIPHLVRLRRMRDRLAEALLDKDCIALVAIDYPGFNMELNDLLESEGYSKQDRNNMIKIGDIIQKIHNMSYKDYYDADSDMHFLQHFGSTGRLL